MKSQGPIEPDAVARGSSEPTRALADIGTRGPASSDAAVTPASPETAAPPWRTSDQNEFAEAVTAPDPGPRPPRWSDTGAGADTEDVRRMVTALVKALKMVRFYPPENVMCRRTIDDLVSIADEILSSHKTVRLVLGNTKVFFSGEVVLEQPGREDSLPGHLFWNGVREVCLHEGLTQSEIQAFLSLLGRSMSKAASREDDVVTLLWDSDLKHITYVAVDDLLDLENEGDPIPEEFGTEFIHHVDLEMNTPEEEEEAERRAKEMGEQIRHQIKKEDVQLFSLTVNERESLLDELNAEETPEAILDGSVRILIETLYNEQEESAFLALVQTLADALVGRICEGRLSEATSIVRVLMGLHTNRDTLSDAMRGELELGIRVAYDSTRRDILVFHLDSGDIQILAELDPFMQALPEDSIGPWCEILGKLESARARRRVIDSLVRKAGRNCRQFIRYLKDERWYLVRNVALILGLVGNEQAISPLAEVLEHKDYRVRREALEAINEIAPETTVNILARTLSDEDPRVRTAGARSIATAGRPAVTHLKTAIATKEFEKRLLSEKQAFFEALGYAGAEQVVPFLAETLKRRALFNRANLDELRACACCGLGWAGGGEAVDILTRYLQDRSPAVREAAQAGLSRISAGQEREPFQREAA